jgi:hypothetical protein
VLELQEMIEHHEYNVIRQTLDLIHSHDFHRIRTFIRSNIQKSIEWCKEYFGKSGTRWFEKKKKFYFKDEKDMTMFILRFCS